MHGNLKIVYWQTRCPCQVMMDTKTRYQPLSTSPTPAAEAAAHTQQLQSMVKERRKTYRVPMRSEGGASSVQQQPRQSSTPRKLPGTWYALPSSKTKKKQQQGQRSPRHCPRQQSSLLSPRRACHASLQPDPVQSDPVQSEPHTPRAACVLSYTTYVRTLLADPRNSPSRNAKGLPPLLSKTLPVLLRRPV